MNSPRLRLIFFALVGVWACSKEKPAPSSGQGAAPPAAGGGVPGKADAAAVADAGQDGADADSDPCGDESGEVPACNSFADAGADAGECLVERCEALTMALKPRIARAAVACLRANPTCSGGPASACIGSEVTTACRDTRASDDCSTIRTTCGNATALPNCEATLSAFTPKGRFDVLACMLGPQGGCDDDKFFGCAAR